MLLGLAVSARQIDPSIINEIKEAHQVGTRASVHKAMPQAHAAQKHPSAQNRPPNEQFKDAADPQYQTLANVDNQIFDKNDGAAGKPFKEADDPNYQTLAGLDNEQVKKKFS